jgi:hypothetical protein
LVRNIGFKIEPLQKFSQMHDLASKTCVDKKLVSTPLARVEQNQSRRREVRGEIQFPIRKDFFLIPLIEAFTPSEAG